MLLKSQRNWLRYIHDGVEYIGEYSGVDTDTQKTAARQKQIDWLITKFLERDGFLADAKKTSGDLTFYTIGFYKALPLYQGSVCNHGHGLLKRCFFHKALPFSYDSSAVQSHESVFLQINNPKNESEAHFNALVQSFPNDAISEYHDPSIPSNDSEEITSIEVDPYLIQIDKLERQYSGGAHGYSLRPKWIWLRKEGRKLEAEDIFAAPDWKNSFNKILTAVENKKQEACVNQDVLNPQKWIIRDEGLVVDVDMSYDCGSYASGGEMVLSWQDLKPYLNPSPPFPIPPKTSFKRP